jgi:hypothetical protein
MKEKNISIYDPRSGNVPSFFGEIWKQQYGSYPYENEAQCDKFDFKATGFMLAITYSTIGTIAVWIWFFVGSKCPWYPPPVLTLLTILIWVLYFRRIPRQGIKAHYKTYYSSIEGLFSLFGIEPSPAIGKMSREEFEKAIAGSLRAYARSVETKDGFLRIAVMNKWKHMHRAALVWTLCEETFDPYFPKKETTQPK